MSMRTYVPSFVRSSLYILLVSVLTLVPAARADILTLQDALEEARRNNADLQAERLRVQSAAGDRRQAGLLFQVNPALEVERGTDRGLTDDGERTLRLSLSQELEVWGQRGKRKHIADLELQRAAAEVDRFTRLLESDLIASYHTHALTLTKLALAKEFVDLMKQVSEASERRFATGDISGFELSMVAGELADRVADVRSLEGASGATAARLNHLIGRSPASPLTLVSDSMYVPFAQPLESLIGLSLDRRADLRGARLAEQISDTRARLVASEAIPNPELTFSYEIDEGILKGEDFSTASGAPPDIRDVRDRDRLFAVGLSLPLPVFNRNQGIRFSARAGRDRATRIREGIERRVEAEVTAAYRELEGARAALESYLPVIDRVSRGPALLGRAYAAGELDLNGLFVQMDRVYQVQLAFLDATIVYRSAHARLEAATGGALLTHDPTRTEEQ